MFTQVVAFRRWLSAPQPAKKRAASSRKPILQNLEPRRMLFINAMNDGTYTASNTATYSLAAPGVLATGVIHFKEIVLQEGWLRHAKCYCSSGYSRYKRVIHEVIGQAGLPLFSTAD